MAKFFLTIFLIIAPNTFAQTTANEHAPAASPSSATSESGEKSGVEKRNSGVTNPQNAAEETNVEAKTSRYVSKTEAARIPRFDAAPVIDGHLNDAVWQTAGVFG